MSTARNEGATKKPQRMKPRHVGTIGLPDEEGHEYYTFATLEIERTGSIYSFYLKPTSVEGALYLSSRGSQKFLPDEPVQVAEMNYHNAWNRDALVRDKVRDIFNDYGVTYPWQEVLQVIKDDRKQYVENLPPRRG